MRSVVMWRPASSRTFRALRTALLSLIAASIVGMASPASAAPTCEDQNGRSIRCGSSGAMPVGWTARLEPRLNRHASGPVEPTAIDLGGVAALIALLIVLIALMPDFDGWNPEDGDRQDGDDLSARPADGRDFVWVRRHRVPGPARLPSAKASLARSPSVIWRP